MPKRIFDILKANLRLKEIMNRRNDNTVIGIDYYIGEVNRLEKENKDLRIAFDLQKIAFDSLEKSHNRLIKIIEDV